MGAGVHHTDPRLISDTKLLEQLVRLKGITERLREARAPREPILNLSHEELPRVLCGWGDLSHQALPRDLVIAVQAPNLFNEIFRPTDVLARTI